MNLKQVLLGDIDVSSERHDKFLFNYGRDLNEIVDSISKVGLINPVILTKYRGSDEKFNIVCGYQRVMAFQKLGKKVIEAKVLEGPTDEGLFLLSLNDNLFSRVFNEIEKAIVAKKFLDIGYSYERLMSEIAPLLGMPPNKKIVDKYLSLLNLDKEIKDSVARNQLELENAFLLISLGNEERKSVYVILFKESSTNVNEARDTIRNLLDLKRLEQKGIKELLSSKEITNILSDKKFNKRQKGEKIYKLIKSMRYPAISKKEEEFSESCKKLGIDNNVRITHSRFFEGNDIQITIKASEEKKLKIDLEKLLLNVKSGAFKRIFSIFR
ncbi:MAG: ParB/RepB/Spo0J family partition protein [Candidatus Scalinduaceae bacterium]